MIKINMYACETPGRCVLQTAESSYTWVIKHKKTNNKNIIKLATSQKTVTWVANHFVMPISILAMAFPNKKLTQIVHHYPLQ